MKVAIIQHAPEYLDKKRSLEKALVLIKEAVSGGNVLAVFGESWLSGYPAWLDYCPGAALWNHEPTKEVFAKTYENAIVIDGPEMAALQQAAAELGIAVRWRKSRWAHLLGALDASYTASNARNR